MIDFEIIFLTHEDLFKFFYCLKFFNNVAKNLTFVIV
jgi:hypothetical protein